MLQPFISLDHVAQWIRHQTSDLGIAGSSPVMVENQTFEADVSAQLSLFIFFVLAVLYFTKILKFL